jgi:hypothetical protein
MEEQENKTKGEDNTHKKSKNKHNNPLEGIDVEGLGIPDWLKHLLTGAGALGANYFLFIKPIQDKMEMMNLQLTKQESRIKVLEQENERLSQKVKHETEANQFGKTVEEDYFTLKRNNSFSGKTSYSAKSVHL